VTIQQAARRKTTPASLRQSEIAWQILQTKESTERVQIRSHLLELAQRKLAVVSSLAIRFQTRDEEKRTTTNPLEQQNFPGMEPHRSTVLSEVHSVFY
jgi:hypothetical protein